MTTDNDPPAEDPENTGLSLLPEPDLGLRVLPSQFARMLGVSRQTVSRWVQDGKVLVDPSGRLDPVKATERVLRHSNPARLRATLLKPVMDDMAGLRTELQEATARAEAAEARAAETKARADEAEADVAIVEAAGDRFIADVVTRLDALAAMDDPDAVRAELDDLYMDALDAAYTAAAKESDHSPSTGGAHSPAWDEWSDPGDVQDLDDVQSGALADELGSQAPNGGTGGHD